MYGPILALYWGREVPFLGKIEVIATIADLSFQSQHNTIDAAQIYLDKFKTGLTKVR